MAIKVALLGFGTVGQGVYETIKEQREKLYRLIGEDIEVAAVLVKNDEKPRSLPDTVLVTTDFDEIASVNGLQVAVEAIVGVEPAFRYNLALLKKGVHVISANKECVAREGAVLEAAADRAGVRFCYEASVAGGIPVVRTLQDLLKVNAIVKIEAILNGTSNFILSERRKRGTSLNDALDAARKQGFAEADSAKDVEGWDAFYKIMILARLAGARQLSWEGSERIGITNLSTDDLAKAKQKGLRIKLLATFERTSQSPQIAVRPVFLSEEHPLYAVEGVDNAVVIYGDIVGRIVLQGPGAGAKPTASAIIEDLVSLFTENRLKRFLTEEPVQVLH
ncbi:MAG TPA: homoserine dehydrogenase [Bacillales bacterium]|nr:homoserine dehydrogenase [Bacillales bacterium]